MMVKSVTFNWRQCGSVQDREGCGEDYEKVTVGEKGVVAIEENEPRNGLELWNYVVCGKEGVISRIFNPNFVEYFPFPKRHTGV